MPFGPPRVPSAPMPFMPSYAYMMNPPPPSFAGVGNNNKARHLSSQAATTATAAEDAFFRSHKAHVLNAAAMVVADTSAKPAASAAMAWLNSLAFDVEGRLAALRKSQKRIKRVQSLFREKKRRRKQTNKEEEATDASQPREDEAQATQQPLIQEHANGGGASDSAAAIAASDQHQSDEEMLKKKRMKKAKMLEKLKLRRAKLALPAHVYESPVAVSLFRDMELALLSESRKLEMKAKKIEEMKALCVVEQDPRPVGCTDVVVDAKAEHRSSASDEAATTEETMPMDIDGNARTERPGSAKSNAVPLSQTATTDVNEKNAGSKAQTSVMLMNQKTTAAAVISTAARVFSVPSQSYSLM